MLQKVGTEVYSTPISSVHLPPSITSMLQKVGTEVYSIPISSVPLLIILPLPAPAHARQKINVGCGQEWSPVPAARNGLHAAMVRPWTTMVRPACHEEEHGARRRWFRTPFSNPPGHHLLGLDGIGSAGNSKWLVRLYKDQPILMLSGIQIQGENNQRRSVRLPPS